jgi:F-type H+-transporting ATPase subunit a
MEHGFSWVAVIPGLERLRPHTATAILVAILVVGFGWRARRGLGQATDPAVPDGRLTARDAFELAVAFVQELAESIIGHHAERYVPFFASLFVFILACNLIGLVPGFAPPTDSFNTTFGLGAVSFGVYNYFGIREHGVRYAKQFLGPVLLLAPLMLVVELFSHLFRPLSLAIRLYGNMFADHLVLGIFTGLTKVAIPVAFYALGAFVSLVQAFVFTLLSIVYVALAVSHEH